MFFTKIRFQHQIGFKGRRYIFNIAVTIVIQMLPNSYNLTIMIVNVLNPSFYFFISIQLSFKYFCGLKNYKI